ncbi:hypothetical protein Fcan01_22903 [Folsomia candida]|uniref:DUF4806 domain-containing protein n=1 Tax=Folsomia candida TaxID=158441 RepID=A0A226DCN2_FOLCA|nr:hypothetical protein Fcan01_22903 [Folsomia candida]
MPSSLLAPVAHFTRASTSQKTVLTMNILKSKPFAVVEFVEKDKTLVSVVSANCLSAANTQCYWPSGPGSHQKLINHIVPDVTWEKYQCSLLKFSSTIESATKSANAARTSDKLSSSEVEIAAFSKGRPPPRRRRKNKVAAAVKIVTPSTDSGDNSEEDVSSGGDPVVSGLVNLINSVPTVIENPSSDPQPGRQPTLASVDSTVVNLSSPIHHPPAASLGGQIVDLSQNEPGSQIFSVVDVVPLFASLTELINYFKSENNAFQTKVTEELVKIRGHQEEILRRTAGSFDESLLEDDPNRPDIPLSTPQNLDLLNDWLKTNQSKTILVEKLRYFGGKNPNEIVSRILEQLLLDKLAKTVSLTETGKCAKRGLKNSKLQQVLYEAVQLNRSTRELTNSEIDDFTKRWPKNSKDRNGGRKQRNKEGCPTGRFPNEQQDGNIYGP